MKCSKTNFMSNLPSKMKALKPSLKITQNVVFLFFFEKSSACAVTPTKKQHSSMSERGFANLKVVQDSWNRN